LSKTAGRNENEPICNFVNVSRVVDCFDGIGKTETYIIFNCLEVYGLSE
jgi:hypothetical protein